MAQITDELVLQIDQALRDVGRIETALDRALAPVEVQIDSTSIDQARDSFREVERATEGARLNADQFEDKLREVEVAADRIVTEVLSIEDAAGRAETNFRDVAAALGVSEDRARDMAREILDAQAASNRVEEAARDVARAMGLADKEAEEFVNALQRADREADQVVQSTNRIAGGFTSIRGAAAGLLAGFGATAAIGAAVRLAGDARTAFADLQDSVNAVKVVFGEAAAPIEDFGQTVAQTAGLSMAEFNQAAAILGSSLINVGLGADEAARKTIDLTQRAADMASIFGGPVSGALDAIMSALRGEGNPIERFGVTITAAKVQAEAAALGFQTVGGELDATAKAAATLEIIMRETNRTAGDFVNTAGDLANATKIANAEFTNAKAGLGEALLPVFQAFLDIAPGVLESLEDLAPALSAMAVSLGEVAASTPGAIDLLDILNLITDIPRGFGQLGDIAQLQLTGIANNANAVGVALTEGPVAGIAAFQKGIKDAFTQFSKSANERRATQGLINDLREGADAAVTLANRLADVGSKGKLDPQFILGLSQVAGVDLQTNVLVLQSLIDEADRLNLASDDVAALYNALAILNDSLGGMDIDALHEFNRIARESVSDIPFETTTTRFTTFSGDVKTAADAAALELEELAAASEAQAQRTADAFDLFADQPEKIAESFKKGVAALRAEVTAQLDFDANIAILRALNLDALADDFERLGVGASDQLVQALNNIPLAIETDALLQGMGVIGEEAFDALVAEFVKAGITGEDVAKLKESLASPQVIAAAEEAGKSVGAAQSAARHEQLTEDLDQLVPEEGAQIGRLIDTHWRLEEEANASAVATGDSFLDGIAASITPESVKSAMNLFGIDVDLTEIGKDAGYTLITGMVIATSSSESVSRLRSSITETIDSAIYRDSPPKLFLDIGKESGDAFWSGFNQSDLTLRTALPPVTGSITTAGSGATASGGVNVNINLDHASLADPVSEVARMAQIAGSVAHTYNAVRN